MTSVTLNPDTRAQVAAALTGPGWIVACLCAAWCGTCSGYRAVFDALAARHPDKFFLWIDIEDQAEMVGELDVENFPTLLIQQGNDVAFFGTVLPDPGLAHRLLMVQSAYSAQELAALAQDNPQRQHWQSACNLRLLLNAS